MKKTSVLLADRHPGLVGSIRDLLEPLFDTVVMVSDEKSLIETLDRFNPDLVVAALAIPVTGAENVAALLNQHDTEVKFIILSDHTEREVMESCKKHGASGYILKRSSARELIKAVQVVQNGDTYFSLGSDASKRTGPAAL
jgi:DNA-binding NarL/FixJ family response regulator